MWDPFSPNLAGTTGRFGTDHSETAAGKRPLYRRKWSASCPQFIPHGIVFDSTDIAIWHTNHLSLLEHAQGDCPIRLCGTGFVYDEPKQREALVVVTVTVFWMNNNPGISLVICVGTYGPPYNVASPIFQDLFSTISSPNDSFGWRSSQIFSPHDVFNQVSPSELVNKAWALRSIVMTYFPQVRTNLRGKNNGVQFFFCEYARP